MIWFVLACAKTSDRAPAPTASSARLSWPSTTSLTPPLGKSYAYFGSDVAGLGDLDGDGYGEVGISAPGADGIGAVTLFYGSSSGPDTSAKVTLDGQDDEEDFGASICGPGDVNGDGYDDLVVASPGAQLDRGAITLYLGSAEGLGAGERSVPFDASAGDFVGFPVAPAGDVNGDGLADLLVGAVGNSDTDTYAGAVYLYLGDPAGLASPSLIQNASGVAFDTFGYALGHGDFDGDGTSDVVIGANGDDTLANNSGAVFITYGSATGLGALSKLVASDGASTDTYGASVTGVPDTNGDGYDELLVGAYLSDARGLNSGAAYLYLGSASGIDASSERVLTATDAEEFDNFGVSVAGTGDLNGDGFGDLIIGAWDEDQAGFNAGAAYVFLGSSTGIQAHAQDKRTAPAPSDTQYFGAAVYGAGDVDADGYSDLVIGAEGDDTQAHDGGRAWYQPGTCERIWYRDTDGDGWGVDTDTTTDCTAPSGYVALPDDCEPDDPTKNPGAPEGIDDGVDQNCDGVEDCWADLDTDGYRGVDGVSSTTMACDFVGVVDADFPGGDCADDNAAIYPGAPDTLADGVDSDCDGEEDCWADGDGDGVRTESTVRSSDSDCDDNGEASESTPKGDCDDNDPNAYPGAPEEVGDEVDSDCDGTELCWVDADNDGVRTESVVLSSDAFCQDDGQAASSEPIGDCDDLDPTVYPSAPETVADGVDADCDGEELCPVDADGDGVVGQDVVASGALDCEQTGLGQGDWADGDCDDGDESIFPGAPEIEDDGIDQNCDGSDAISEAPAKGCGGCGGSTGGWWLLGALALIRRRAK